MLSQDPYFQSFIRWSLCAEISPIEETGSNGIMKETIALHIFLECNSAHNDQIFDKRLGNLASDTNAHVGLKGALKAFLHSKENSPNKLVQGTSNWAVLLSK